MGHPDQHTPEDHNASNREHAPEPDLDESIKEDLGEESSKELKERADTGVSTRSDEPDEGRESESGHNYMGRQMDERLKSESRMPPEQPDADEG